jgi:hypothetical protein
VTTTGSVFATRRQLIDRYTHLREDHLRYMQKWGLIRPERRSNGEEFFSFTDLATIRQTDEALADGAKFRAVLRNLLASRSGQLSLDFRIEAQPAKILQLRRREPPPLAALMEPLVAPRTSSDAEQYFLTGARLDSGDPTHFDEAASAYRRALEMDPYLVPAIINLANIHYSRDEIAEAQACTSAPSHWSPTSSRPTSIWATSFTTLAAMRRHRSATAMRSG